MFRMRECCVSGILGLALLSGVACAQPGALADPDRATGAESGAGALQQKHAPSRSRSSIFSGSLYYSSGQLQKALDYLNEALPIEQKYLQPARPGHHLDTMGRIYTDLGQEDKALELLNQALPMWRALGARAGEAETLNYIGKVYNNLGQHEEALKYLNQSLDIWHAIDMLPLRNPCSRQRFTLSCNIHACVKLRPQRPAAPVKAGTLDNLGRTYSDMGHGTAGAGILQPGAAHLSQRESAAARRWC